MRLRFLVAALVLCAGMSASASPITYTVSDTASGSLGGVAFTNALVTLNFYGNTSNVTGGGGFYTNSVGTGTVQIGSGPAVNFTDPNLEFFVNQTYTSPTAAAGIGGSSGSILDVFSDVFKTYNGTTPIGPVVGAPFINAGSATATANGAFIINSAGSSATFLATAGTVTPEPSSIALFGTGMLGILGVVRRRSA